MGILRTINHPGIEIQEVDMSGSTEQVGGCTSLVMGFFPQGESGKPVNPTSLASVKSYFGTPENEAERYAYYACKTVFDNGGNLVAARIPYNNNSQYLTPAVTYSIEEWSTQHESEYEKGTGKIVSGTAKAKYGTNAYEDKGAFADNSPNMYSQPTYSTTVAQPWQANPDNYIADVNVYAISSTAVVSASPSLYYTISYDMTQDAGEGCYVETGGFQIDDGDVEYTFGNFEDLLDSVPAEAGLFAAASGDIEASSASSAYLTGNYPSGTYFKSVAAFAGSVEITGSVSDTLTGIIVGATEYDPIYFLYEEDTDGVTPQCTVETSRVSITVNDDGYTFQDAFDRTITVANGDVYYVKSIEDGKNYTITDTAGGGAEFTPVESGEDNGYWVYSIASSGWRSLYNYEGEPDNEWVPTTDYRKYASFSVKTSGGNSSDGTFNTSDFVTFSTNTTSLTTDSEHGCRIEGSIVDGSVKFIRGNTTVATAQNLVFCPMLNPNSEFVPDWLSGHMDYFTIHAVTLSGWDVTHGESSAEESTFYAETLCSSNGVFYSSLSFTPATAEVDYYTDDGTGTAKAIAIKSYYRNPSDDGRVPGGVAYPEVSPEDYLELRIWDSTMVGKPITAFTKETTGSWDIVHRKYVGALNDKTVCERIKEGGFKCAPLTSDVTNGYVGDDGVDSGNLAITEDARPEVNEYDPFGNGVYMKLLYKTNDGNTHDPEETGFKSFYQFVSPYFDPEAVQNAKSEKYQWIHWVVHEASETVKEPGVLLSRTLGCELSAVPQQLRAVENLVTIVPDPDDRGYIPLSEYQDYRDEAKTPELNKIVIANITEQKFGSDIYNNAVVSEGDSGEYDYADEVLGIMPVLMGGFQALPRQSRIELPDATNGRIFNALEAIARGSSIENDPAPEADHVPMKAITLNPDGYTKTLGATGEYDAFEQTYSNQLLAKVPPIDLNAAYRPNGAKTNYVTLAVCKLSLSKADDNKIALTVLETFTGSLNRDAKDETGKKSMFIDNVVNNEDTGSTYVRLFSNYRTALTGEQHFTASSRTYVRPASDDTKVTLAVPASLGEKHWWTVAKPFMSLGFTEEQTKKYISYATMVATVENVFDALSNVDELDLDLVVDAGLTTIANRLKRITDKNPEITKDVYDVFYENIDGVDKVAGWKSMCSKLTTFCQTTRKDCIALLDAPRNLCVKDNVKLVQPGSGRSVDYDILPKFNYLGGMNSSYAAGYCDWLQAVDDFTSKSVWLPPSIAAEGSVIFTDYNSNYWMAPAGQNRGNVTWAVDIAFNPNAQQQDSIYSKAWNYALSSSGNIMVWGQKTMLNSTSSFNRINIRRLFCRLERMVRKNSKWVIFELNNERTRNIYKDRIDPIFANVKAMGGIYDYRIYCDTSTNTPTVIQNNEFRAAFAIKPEYVAEYIILTFFNLGRDIDFSEVVSQL